MNLYWRQKASTWVSLAVLAGGLVSACLLVFVYKIEKNFEVSASEMDLNSYLEGRGY